MKPLRYGIIYCLLWLSLGVGAAQKSPKLLRELGFQLLNETPAPVSLPTLKGKTQSLKAQKGHWTWLVFWATWCGPCRYEMPQLQGLHQKFHKKGLRILGVAVDGGNREGVQAFVDEQKITFPILLDTDSKVASAYQASAIPILYVVSPDGKLAGVLRGAKDWSGAAVAKTLSQLLKTTGYEPSAKVASTGALPANLKPPKLQWIGLQPTYSRDSPFDLRLRVEWEGDSRQYLMKVPKLTVPEGVVLGPIRSESSTTETTAVLEYLFPITLSSEAKSPVSVGPVELAYQHRGGSQEQFTRLNAIPLSVSRPRGLPPWAGISGGILVLGLVIGGILWWKKRRTKVGLSEAVATVSMAERYEALRTKKMTSGTRYVPELLALYGEVVKDSAIQAKLERQIEGIRFGGLSLSAEEIRHYEKRLESVLKGGKEEGMDDHISPGN